MRFIDDRPAEAEGRQVPGHWEGDLLVGKNCASAVSTLVERTSRYLVLAPLKSRDSVAVTAAVAEQIKGLPDTLRRTLTWDCGAEMARHPALSVAADIDVYFAHPHSPWERGTNETPTGGYGSTSPKAPQSPTTRTTSKPSPTNSTTGLAVSSDGPSQMKSSPSC